MGETKAKSSNIICIILIVILVIGCGVLYYFGFVQKDRELEEVKAKLALLENNNTEKESSSNPIDTEKKSDKKVETISESEALKIAEELYDKADLLYFGRVVYDGENQVTIDGKPYGKVTNINEAKQIFSKKGWEEYLEKNGYVIEHEGEYYRVLADRGADITYLGKELKIVQLEEDKVVFDSVEKYVASMEEAMSGKSKDEMEKREVNNTFIIVKEDGEWKVEEFTLAE